jgi:hypothetical protein
MPRTDTSEPKYAFETVLVTPTISTRVPSTVRLPVRTLVPVTEIEFPKVAGALADKRESPR